MAEGERYRLSPTHRIASFGFAAAIEQSETILTAAATNGRYSTEL